LLRSGAVDLRPVVTHTFPLKDYEAGFAAMTAPARDCGKVVFVP
jgi:threonine 3-dehydrogenase